MFYGLPAQSLDLNCNLFMTFLSFAQNSFYDTNAVERNLSFCHKLVPNASVYNIQAVCSLYNTTCTTLACESVVLGQENKSQMEAALWNCNSEAQRSLVSV